MPFEPIQTISEDTKQKYGGESSPLDFFTEIPKGIARGFLGVGAALTGTAEWIVPGQQESMIDAKKTIQEYRDEKFSDDKKGAAAWAGRVIGEALPYLGSSVIGGTAAGTVGALIMGFSVAGDQAYDDAIKSGASKSQANRERVVIGTINAAIEHLQVSKILKFKQAGRHSVKGFVQSIRNKTFKKLRNDVSKFTGDVLKVSIEEGIEEALQEGVSLGVPMAWRDAGPKNPDGSTDWFEVGRQIGGAALGGAVAGGVLGGSMALAQGGATAAAPTTNELMMAQDAIKSSKLSDIEKNRALRKLQELDVFNDDGVDINPDEKAPGTAQEPQTIKEGTADITLIKNAKTEAFDTAADKLKKGIETMEVHRGGQKRVMRQELGKRFSEYTDIKGSGDNARVSLALARGALEGQLLQDFTPLKDQFTEGDIDSLYGAVRDATVQPGVTLDMEAALNKLIFDGKLPAKGEIGALQEILGEKTVERLQNISLTKGQKAAKLFFEALNIPRALLASHDFSGPGRQGLMFLGYNPKIWSKANVAGYRAFASPEYAHFQDIQIKTNPNYQKAVESGLDITPIEGLSKGEEPYAYSQLAEKFPLFGPGIKASNFAYSTAMNKLRADIFYSTCESWEGSFRTKGDYKLLAEFINHATGRGTLPKTWLKKYGATLNALFFAPRLTMGRIQALGDILPIQEMQNFYAKRGDLKAKGATKEELKDVKFRISPARKIVARDLISSAAILTLLLSVIKFRGDDDTDVELDPRSSDFLKARIGNTRLDFTAGYGQILRLAAQIITAERKSTTTDEIMPEERNSIVWRFIQSKMSPPAGFAVDMIRGETFLGDKLSLETDVVAREAFQRFIPLFFQDCIDAVHYQGLHSLRVVAPLALHGVGAQTYPKRDSQKATELKDYHAKQTYGAKWNELGPNFQDALRRNYPDISAMETKAKQTADNFDYIGKLAEKQKMAGDKVFKTLPSGIREELKKLGVGIGGITQTIDSDWHLNEKRYKDYQNEVSANLKIAIPRLTAMPTWKTMTDMMKVKLLEKAIKMSKEKARTKIIREAKFSDLQRV
jgi:hypothetical protein